MGEVNKKTGKIFLGFTQGNSEGGSLARNRALNEYFSGMIVLNNPFREG